MLCIDLDRFKLVNDTLGHPVGDALLVQVSEKLREASRENDFVARIGGDEFAIIQMDAQQPNAAHSLAHRLTELLGCPLMIGDHTLTIGVSVGVGIAPDNGQTPECLLKSADLALYRAKEDGRGVFRFFEPGMDEAMQTRRRLESDLRSAINKGDFELSFQPQVRVGTGTVVGFEALLRWQHPERGSVAPSDFLLVAEEAGLTAAIGAWVLRTACKEAAGWSSAVSVSVNLSPAQFREAGLIGMVVQALAYSGLEPQRLELEITEGALLGGFDETLCILRKFHALGVRVTVDDFGKGFSLLSYMPRFPFHKIKIDPSFVNDMDKPEARAIVRAIADLAANLGLTTTAEGVETIEQLAQVRSEGCTDAQGFLIGHPLSPTGVRHFLRSVPPGATQAA